MPSFLELGVPARLSAVLTDAGMHDPFPIQAATLPDSLAGRDVLGRGRTGSGKTIAFALPLVARLASDRGARTPSRPRGLVLAPTRELATQIAATIAPLAEVEGMRVTTIFGGVSQRPQEQALRSGVDIVVACPGRLEDLMKQGHVSLDRIRVTVLDEADHMADLGFLPGVTRILSATPADGQRLLFSATLDNGIDSLSRRFLHNPANHEADRDSVPQGTLTHRVLLIDTPENKTVLVRELASGQGRRILFTRTKHQAKKLAKQLTAAGIPAVDLHGNLSQNARDRNLAAFSAGAEDGGVRVLVATDVAARGVHVDDVELVVHVDPPVEHKAYLHRSGRTARAGASGTVVTVGLAAQKREVSDLLKKAAISVPFESVTANSAAVAELVGERAPHVAPAPATSAPRAVASGSRPGRASGSGRRSGQAGSSGRGSAAAAADTASGASRRRRGRGGSARPDHAGAVSGPTTSARNQRSARSTSDASSRERGAAPRSAVFSTSTPADERRSRRASSGVQSATPHASSDRSDRRPVQGR